MANKQTNDDKQAVAECPCNEIETSKNNNREKDSSRKQNGNEEHVERADIDPTLHDVLLRSCEESRNNPGNIRFHEVSETFVTRFLEAKEKNQKIAVAEDLVSAVRTWGGRFLDFSEKNSGWFVIDQKRAQRKCHLELLKKSIHKQTKTQYKEHGEGKNVCGLPSGIGLTTETGHKDIYYSSSCSDSETKIDNRKVEAIPSNFSINHDNRKTDTIQEQEKLHNDDTKSDGESRDSIITGIRQTVEASNEFTLSKLLHSIESTSQIFTSTDSVAKLFSSRSGGTIDLPPLSLMVGDGCNALAHEDPNRDLGQHPFEKECQNIGSNSQIPSSYGAAALFLQPQSGTDDKISAHVAKGEATHEATASPEEAIAGEEMPSQDIAALAESLVKSQEALIQKLLESVSRAQQSVILAQETSNADEAPERVGLFASREWGSDLGPFQDVDYCQLFHTENHEDTEIKSGHKAKRDWNALVVQNLHAGVKTTERSGDTAALGASATNHSILPAGVQHLSPAKIPFADHSDTKESGSIETQDQFSTEEDVAVSEEDNNQNDHCKGIEKAVKASASPKSTCLSKFVEPTEDDVLLGRGGRTNNNPGNKKYLEVKDQMQPRYLAAEKNEKTVISQELVDIVHEWGGRFLKLDPPKDRWYEIDEEAARKKCSQSLREVNTPEERAAKRARYRYTK